MLLTAVVTLLKGRGRLPLLEAVLGFDITLGDAAKCLLLAMEATMRLNVAVGAPIDAFAGLWSRGMHELCARAPAVEWR